MSRMNLPKKEADLVEALDAESIASEQEANIHLTSHKIIDAYLSGVRRFKILDRWSGNMTLAFENSKGELDMRYEEIVRVYLSEVGRYMKMDISPIASKKGESLGALRKAAIANAALGSLSNKLPQTKLKRRAIIPFLKYGTVGISHVETGEELNPDMVEIIHPRQLRGYPAWVDGSENLTAIGRKRWVPLDWLQTMMKTVYDKKFKITNPMERFRAQDVSWGGLPPDKSMNNHAGQAATTSVQRARRSDMIGTNLSPDQRFKEGGDIRKKDGRFYVPLEEIYVYDDTQEFLARYIIKAGETILWDEDFEEQGIQVLCPLHIARHTDVGKMFARGFVAPLIPLNDQIEKMMSALFKNIQEMDQFGTLFLTGGMGVDIKKWKTGPRPKVEIYEPDPLDPKIAPQVLQPANSGTGPSRIAEFAQAQLQNLAGQGPIFQGQTSGRVDSAAGLGFLFNTGNISLGLPVNGLADAFTGVYARMLQSAKERLAPGQTIELATIDDAIAGVVIDRETGLLSLSDNPIPNAWEVAVDIKDRTPKDRDVRTQELKELVGMGLVDPTRFWITALEENLELPGAPKELWETWRKVTWQIIMLFRDGKTPGTAEVGEHTQNPDIHLIAIQQFMNKIEFSLASKEVREAFENWKTDLEILAGKNFPAGLPAPEVAAQMQAAGGQQRPGNQSLGIPPGISPGGPL